MAVVLTLAQTKQIRLNIHERRKNTVQTIQNTVNTSTHITRTPTHYKTHTCTHPHITNPTHTHPHITTQVKTTTVQATGTTVQVCLARMSKFHTADIFESGDTDFEIALWEIRSEMKLGHLRRD